MGLFSKPVTDKELRDFRRGKPVREAVAKESAKRNGGSKQAAKAIRRGAKSAGSRITQADLDAIP